MRLIGALLLAVVAMLVSLAWSQREPVTGLAECAARAKRQGLRSTSCTDISDVVDGDLADLLTAYSLVVARPSRLSALQTQTRSAIFTWDVVQEVRVLSRGQSNHHCAFQLPRRLRFQPSERAIPRYGGTAVISGIEVNVAAGWRPTFEATDRRYVFLADVCSDQLMILPKSGMEVYVVDDDERLLPAHPHVSLRYQRQIEALGTLGALQGFALAIAERSK